MSQQEEDPSHYTRTLVVKPALSQMYDQLLPKAKSLENGMQNHCSHTSAPRHVRVPRSRNFSDCSRREAVTRFVTDLEVEEELARHFETRSLTLQRSTRGTSCQQERVINDVCADVNTGCWPTAPALQHR